VQCSRRRSPWTTSGALAGAEFSAQVLARLEDRRRERFVVVPYFAGLIAGETDALINSFAGEPQLHHPFR
jgi:hypothetical protein